MMSYAKIEDPGGGSFGGLFSKRALPRMILS